MDTLFVVHKEFLFCLSLIVGWTYPCGESVHSSSDDAEDDGTGVPTETVSRSSGCGPQRNKNENNNNDNDDETQT